MHAPGISEGTKPGVWKEKPRPCRKNRGILRLICGLGVSGYINDLLLPLMRLGITVFLGALLSV